VKKLHIISNGYGEDLIASHVAKALLELSLDLDLTVTPLVGDGHRFIAAGFQPSIQNAMLPSGGFLRKITAFFQDLISGMLVQVWEQFKHIRRLSHRMDARVCVGDVFCLVLGTRGLKQTTVFLPTAKSNKFMAHSAIEYWLIRRLANLVVTRDQETADAFNAKGIKAIYVGNPMMDGLKVLSSTGWSVDGVFSDPPALMTVLPGSRDEAYDNMAYIFWLLSKWVLPVKPVAVLVAKAPTLSTDLLIQRAVNGGWEVLTDVMIKYPKNGVVIEFTSRFVDALSVSRCVIGLAGTANEQAVFLNRPVICFEGFGPQSTLNRFDEQRRLLGSLLYVVPERRDQAIFAVLNPLISNPEVPDLPPVQHAARNVAEAIIQVIS